MVNEHERVEMKASVFGIFPPGEARSMYYYH